MEDHDLWMAFFNMSLVTTSAIGNNAIVGWSLTAIRPNRPTPVVVVV